MALISCPECATNVSDKALSCPSCGCPISAPSTPSSVTPTAVTVAKSRGVYIILGILFGAFGFHNFYSGHNLSGGIKIGIILLAFVLDAATSFYTGWSLVALVICELWALLEIMVVSTDASGNKMS
jgi:TM2 domain-containing membrane protein YozV